MTEEKTSSASLASSPSILQETKAPGGIDFRALPAVIQPMPLSQQFTTNNLRMAPAIPLAELNKEWE